MNNDLISREALIDEISREIDFERENNNPITAVVAFKIAIKRARQLPAVDAAPVVHGRWINQDSTYTKYQCSACKERNFDGVGRYCPHCGTKMDAEIGHRKKEDQAQT